jgi:hypothetical protein
LVRSTRILHQNNEYLIQDQASSTSARSIVILARPGSEAGAGSNGFNPIRTNHGDWIPVAKWKDGSFEFMSRGSKKAAAVLETILDKYFDLKGKAKTTKPRKRYYYLEKDGAPCYTLSPTHPNGLAIQVFSNRKGAQHGLVEEDEVDKELKIRQTDDLNGFFIRAADDGYAGAILDNSDPVYFCLDPSDNMVFLKLQMNEEDQVEEHLLEEDGRWSIYEGEEEIDFFLDQDSCDENMIHNLGEIPFLGHKNLYEVWTIEDREEGGNPFVLSAEEGPYAGLPGGKALLLFHQRRHALDFILDRSLINCEAVRVSRLKSFLQAARREGLSVLLEPFSHRATSGTLWLNEEEIILDSFSGFWVMDEEWGFARIE